MYDPLSEVEPIAKRAPTGPSNAPSLEELGADWLQASDSFSLKDSSFDDDDDDDDDGDGVVVYEAPAHVQPEVQQLEEARRKQAHAIARSGILETQKTELDTITNMSMPKVPGASSRRVPIIAAGIALLAIAAVAAWAVSGSDDSADGGNAPPPTTVTANPVVTSEAEDSARRSKDSPPATNEAAAAVLPETMEHAPRIVDRQGERMQLESMVLARPRPGKKCGEPQAHFSIAESRKIVMCIEIDRPVRERVVIYWNTDGKTRRRTVLEVPAAGRFRSRAMLHVDGTDVGLWTARIVADEQELGSIDFVIAK